MTQIIIEKNPSQQRLNELNVSQWPTWEKEISTFPWTFPEQEIAYILEGECIITPTNGTAVHFGKGDLVTFPAGITAEWQVLKPLHKHYHLDGSKLCQIWRRIKLALKLK